jgi:hypothetical protein
MKRITFFKEDRGYKIFSHLYSFLFWVNLKIDGFTDWSKNVYCDNDIIDTLGSRGSVGKFISSCSTELAFTQSINFPFLQIDLVDF